MAFWDFVAVAGCLHPRFLDEPDAFGAQTCAVCECRVTTRLTEALFKTQMNMLATRERFPRPFPEID
jgi:hypothetical protein